ncbi:OmpL47-type beta-barrel domain-containing protein [Paenibacillus sp. GCM10012303]|uniref:OmpL47-type beta-barrel domain-containing protein n=1 Tax=Paenibacillus sp. GCM10012303 TaxID=3317340 RepID=UPI00360E9657
MFSTHWRKTISLLIIVFLLAEMLPVVTSGGNGNSAMAAPPEGSELRFADDGSSLQAAGWSRRIPPEAGVYIIDSSHSLGNPNQTPTKPVQPGQYLLYGDQTASAASRYTTISKKMPIGPGAWTLEFSAKFVDLMKPGQSPVYRGISFEIFAAGKEYKITFNDTNKILAMTNASGAYLQQEAAMPEDDAFHGWEIAYDGNYTVTVKLDGQPVASFPNIGFPVSGREDELVILNAPLNWLSGTNEVYIDSLNMYSHGQSVPTDLLINDDASSLGTAGWSRSLAPLQGLYITDAGNSLGNPNGIQMKAVPEGQYLFYGDQQASVQGKYVRLLKTVPIGPGPWTLEFSARFVDLMKPSANHADRGIYFDIYAAEKRYKITFNDTDKIMANASTQKQVQMPQDDAFHKWEIVFNGSDTVYVKLDGMIVATFVQPATSAAGISDRIQIANVPLNWVSGTNEMYLDYVKLYKMAIGDPDLLIEDDASGFPAAGWTADPPAAGAYFTDHEQTNGSVEGMEPVEEGRYLSYADSSTAGEARLSQEADIGAGPWALVFDARIASLVQPDTPSAEPGFQAEVVAGGKIYRLVFNGGNNLYVSKGDGTYDRIQTNLVSDTYFDNWGIAYDLHGRLLVTRNGSKLGIWTGSGVPAQGPDRVSFVNRASEAAGETTVYLDRIKLSKNRLPVWGEFQPLIAGVTVLPTSDSAEISASVSIFDADPLWFSTNRLTVEAELVQDGQVMMQTVQAVNDHTVPLTLAAGGRTGWMDLVLKLKDGNQVKSEATQKLDVYSSVSLLLPDEEAEAVPGEVYVFDDIDQAKDAAGKFPWQAGWKLASYQYEGLPSGGLAIESTNEAGTLELPVKLNGWYGVYVGYVTGTEGLTVSVGTGSRPIVLDGVTAGEPYGSKAIAEVFALASNFSGGTVSLSPISGKQARIAYVKLKALTPEEIALYTKPDEGAAGKRVIYNNDGYSDYFSGQYDTEQSLLNNAVNFFEDQDVNSLYWTLGTTMLILRDSEAAGRPYANLTPQQEQTLMRDGDKRVRDVVLGYIDAGKDPLAIVANRADELGMDAFASLRMSAFYNQNSYPWLNGARYDEFAGKGYLQRKSDGTPDIRMSYAYPEFRQFVIDVLKEAASVTGGDGRKLVKGVELDYSRYPYVLGFDPVLTDPYFQQYGVKPQDETTPAGQTRWNQFKADVMTGFMRDVRQQLAGSQISVRIPYDVYFQYGLDIETWVQEDLIDRLVVSNIGHENFFPELEAFRQLTEGTGIELYGNINGTLSGSDLTRQQEELIKRGIRVATGHEQVSKQQYMERAHQLYEAGYDGVYIFNNWKGRAAGGQSIRGELGDKVKVEKWHQLAYPAEWMQNLVTVMPAEPQDRIPPEITVSLTTGDGRPYANDTWTNQNVTAHVYAQDELSGLASLEVSRDGGVTWSVYGEPVRFDPNGIFELAVRAADEAGNVALERRTIKISTNGLAVHALLRQADGTPYNSGEWTRHSVTAAVYAEHQQGLRVTSVTYSLDQGLSWQPYTASSPPVFHEDGIHSIRFRAEDEAGNRLVNELIIRIDRTAPSVELTPNGSELSTRLASIKVNVTDPGSGLMPSSLSYAWTRDENVPAAGWKKVNNGRTIRKLLRSGDWYLHIRATDKLGNQAEVRSNRFRFSEPVSSNANLSGIRILDKKVAGFKPQDTNYTVHVGRHVQHITLTPAAQSGEAVIRVKVNDGGYSVVPSGTASMPAALKNGANQVTIQVTAEDGTTLKTYSVKVIKAGPYRR